MTKLSQVYYHVLGHENFQWKKCVMNLKSKYVELFLFMLGQDN
jgi:hypothetical protein